MKWFLTISTAMLMTGMFLLLFLLPRTTPLSLLILGVELFGVVVLITQWCGPRVASFAWRVIGAGFFVAYLAYLISQLVQSGGRFTFGNPPGQPSPLSALRGLLFFGVPGLSVAIWGPDAVTKKLRGLGRKDQSQSGPDSTGER